MELRHLWCLGHFVSMDETHTKGFLLWSAGSGYWTLQKAQQEGTKIYVQEQDVTSASADSLEVKAGHRAQR